MKFFRRRLLTADRRHIRPLHVLEINIEVQRERLWLNLYSVGEKAVGTTTCKRGPGGLRLTFDLLQPLFLHINRFKVPITKRRNGWSDTFNKESSIRIRSSVRNSGAIDYQIFIKHHQNCQQMQVIF